MKVQEYAALEKGAALQPFSYEAAPLKSSQVLVKVTHCGICHSDVHLIDNDWGISSYPLVPGHEVVGVIERCADNVIHLKTGDRVGIGWQSGACLQCNQCTQGHDNLCAKQSATCVGAHGGFADYVIVDANYAFIIPDALPSEQAAPLLCGGITVFSPLEHFQVRPWMHVGVIGLGGLGHLAVKFARSFGCAVTVFSQSSSKADEAMRLGASNFVSSTDTKALRTMKGKLDFIISTVNAEVEWTSYLSALAPDGKLCLVGVPPGDMKISANNLLGGRKQVVASPIGSRWMINTMLDFAARHEIFAETESYALSEVNAALDRVRTNAARFRVVLKV